MTDPDPAAGSGGSRAAVGRSRRAPGSRAAVPVLTFLTGLALGFGIWGARVAPVSDLAQPPAETAASPTVGTPTRAQDVSRIVVTVPQTCTEALDASERSLQLVQQGVDAAGRLDAGEVQRVVGELQKMQGELRGKAEQCRASASATIATGAPTPTP